jgi:hypothetical protein
MSTAAYLNRKLLNIGVATAAWFALLASAGTAEPSAASQCDSLPTVFIIGDSTVNNSTKGQQGWGTPLARFFDLTKVHVEDRARGRRSSRSFLREGLWDQVDEQVRPGDFVLIHSAKTTAGDSASPTEPLSRARAVKPKSPSIPRLANRKRCTPHTTPEGAAVSADCLVAGIRQLNDCPLKKYLVP